MTNVIHTLLSTLNYYLRMIQCRSRRTIKEWRDIVYETTVYVLIGFSGKLPYDANITAQRRLLKRQ